MENLFNNPDNFKNLGSEIEKEKHALAPDELRQEAVPSLDSQIF